MSSTNTCHNTKHQIELETTRPCAVRENDEITNGEMEMGAEFLAWHQLTQPCLHAFLRSKFGIYQVAFVKAPVVIPI
jgi:hypothetical protein